MITMALILIGVTVRTYWFAAGYPFQVVIRTEGETRIFDLNEDRRVHIQGKLGESIIAIEQGRVRFVESACSTRQCILAGWRDHVHDTVACLPNGVSFSLQGRGVSFDSINF